MSSERVVDVAVNIFGKPCQTALSVLSLLEQCGRYIDVVYLQFEPLGSSFDTGLPYAVADYLAEGFAAGRHSHRVVLYQPSTWMQRNAPDPALLKDAEYRLSVRYQHAWEQTDKRHLFIMHNDVFIFKDILSPMLEGLDEAFAIGSIGQCWNCPARLAEAAQECLGQGGGCTPETYAEFQPSFQQLECLYQHAVQHGIFARHYWEGWEPTFGPQPWPLPECRVNEWSCLVNMDLARPITVPNGPVLPFGAFEQCGKLYLDTAVAWFRGMNALGLRAKHLDVTKYMKHWVGTGKKTELRYLQAEDNARQILDRHFKDFAAWCRHKGNGLFF